MAALDWSQCPAVESIPGKVRGAWVFKGTRLPVANVIENLEDLSIDEVIEQFDVTREYIAAVLSSWLRSCAPTWSPPVLVLLGHGTPKGLARSLSGAHHPHVAIQRLGRVHRVKMVSSTCRTESSIALGLLAPNG